MMKSDSTSSITFKQNVNWSKSSSTNDATLENDVAFNCKMYDWAILYLENTHKIMKHNFIWGQILWYTKKFECTGTSNR